MNVVDSPGDSRDSDVR